jgi:hypothetical protein
MKEENKLKAKMMEEAEEIIDELLKWDEKNPKPTLTQIEDIVLELRKRMSERMAEALIEKQANKQPVPGPSCPECGIEMRYKGQKQRQVESRAGGLQLERGHYYCPKCKAGHFPPG